MLKMLDHKHYVPILRWKMAEMEALKFLKVEAKARMTPLIELCQDAFDPKKPKHENDKPKPIVVEDIITKKVNQLHQSWGNQAVFIDLLHLNPKTRTSVGKHIFEIISSLTVKNDTSVIPVTGFPYKDPKTYWEVRNIEYQNAVAKAIKMCGHGACVRLFLHDIIHRKTLKSDIRDLLQALGLAINETDLLIDYQAINNTNPSIINLYNYIPFIDDWRSIIISGGAFPPDLSELLANRTYKLDRLDWLSWSQQVKDVSLTLRLPSYSDYTIQHPLYRKPTDYPKVSASIRYSCNEYWLIMRGEWIGKQGSRGSAQYQAEAQLLCDREEYFGANFSFGDDYIMKKSVDDVHHGNVKEWLRAGINHHLELVIHQIANHFSI